MKKVLLSTLIIFCSLTNAQNKKEKDHKEIKKMCGCYEVTFNFAETFNYSNDTLYKPSKSKTENAMEWVQLVEETDDKISMQHLLQIGGEKRSYIVKHWRQDWLYENKDFYMFNGNNNWKYVRKNEEEVKGQWTQKVFQVDDSPRYERSATWAYIDGKSYWENTTTAPLPRREYTKRSDYNITMRRNRHENIENGWIHDQDNDKVIRETGKKDLVLAKEKGLNTYVKVADEKCQAAQDWWKVNNEKWKIIRNKWDEVYGRNKDLTLEKKVDNKLLYKYLFSEDYESKRKISKIIEEFVVENNSLY
jgi:hypothetical protein